MRIAGGPTAVMLAPAQGGRITSIVMAGREWLQQPATSPTAVTVGSPFVRPDVGGWDEMFPTCAAVPERRWPDHGELWSRPWDVVAHTATTAVLEIVATIEPVRIRRTVEIDPTSAVVRLDYELTNIGDRPAPVFWMAHPLFDARTLTAVELLPGAVAMRLTAHEDGAPADAPIALPTALPSGAFRKHRAERADAVSAVRLVDAGGAAVTMTWRADTPTWFQLWSDTGAFGPYPVVAPEPAVAAGDDPVEAARAGGLPVLDPGGALTATISLTPS